MLSTITVPRDERALAIARAIQRFTVAIPDLPVHRERIATIARLLSDLDGEVPHDHLVLLGRLGFASFVFDDLVDQHDLSTADLRQRAEQVTECATGRYVPEIAFDPLAQFLLHVAEDLRRAPLADALWQHYRRAVRRLFVGIVEHRELADRIWHGDPPGYEELLRVGSRSIGVEAFAVAAWIMLGDAAVVAHDSVLWAITQRLARAARLANDLQTAEREVDERSANVLFVVGTAAVPEIARRIRYELCAADLMMQTLPCNVRSVARFTIDLTRRIVAQYERSDFHERDATASIRATA